MYDVNIEEEYHVAPCLAPSLLINIMTSLSSMFANDYDHGSLLLCSHTVSVFLWNEGMEDIILQRINRRITSACPTPGPSPPSAPSAPCWRSPGRGPAAAADSPASAACPATSWPPGCSSYTRHMGLVTRNT